MSLSSWLGLRRLASIGITAQRRRDLRQNRLHVELLEDRCVLASGLSAALVADIVPGTTSSFSKNLTHVNDTLLLGAKDPYSGWGLWKSDGTAAGTVLVRDWLGSSPSDFTPLGSSVLFKDQNLSLWKTDGTTAGTVVLKSMTIYANQTPSQHMTPMNGKVFFSGDDGVTGAELWVSDGTTAGTKLVKDMYGGSTSSGGGPPRGDGGGKAPNSSLPQWLTNVNGALFFTAYHPNSGRELWKSDGSAKGTTLVKDITPGKDSGGGSWLTNVNGVLYFGAAGGLWKSDGTAIGTVLVRNIGVTELTNVNGTLFFTSFENSTGSELWKSDGTSAGTVMVKDIAPGSDSGNPQALANVNGTLYFNAFTASNGRELWRSDGTAAGTVLVKDISLLGSSVPGGLTFDSNGMHFSGLTGVNGLLYFAADDGESGRELWQSDGTEAGTMMVQDIYPGSTGSDPAYLVSMNNKLYFAATDPVHGRELWDPPPVEPAQGYLLVAEYDNHEVLRYGAATGAFVNKLVPKHSGGLKEPQFLVFGPHDHNLYVGSGHFGGPLKAVLRYNGTSGEFMGEFTESGRLNSVHGVLFGPDGNLYVGDNLGYENGQPAGGRIVRFDGRTGAFLDEFVVTFSGGLRHPFGMVFAPDKKGKLDLFVADEPGNVLRYDGSTGAFLDEFVPRDSGGLDSPVGLSVGPDGNLYVTDLGFDTHNPQVLRYQGPTGRTPGAFIDVFVPAGRGGLLDVQAAIFGPDGNGDGRQDLYVSNNTSNGIGQVKGTNGNVKRYDGVTGAFIDTFIAIGSGGLNHPTGLTFTATDPVTLAYLGDENLTALQDMTNEMLAASQVQPLLTEALARWQGAEDLSSLHGIEIRIDDLRGDILGDVGNTIWLDDNAAGWGWFVDPTPRDDSEFTTPDDQGEQNRIELLTVVMHELRHLLGRDHEIDSVMADTLATGTQRTPENGTVSDSAAIVDLLFSKPVLTKRRR